MNLTNLKLNDRYVIEKELGRGGMGVVYLAHDTRLHSVPVVIKTMLEARPVALDNHWFREKFDKEIQALVRIKHPGVVGLTDLGQMPDGRPFFVMQYVDGTSLRTLIKGSQMEVGRIADIIRQVGSALGAAHAVGVTHRDLKPENVMLQTLRSGEEIVKLIDFGIATVRDLQASQSDKKTVVAGTLPYLSPEQLRGEPVPASDIWSMGVIAYEMVTGRPPFLAANVLALSDLQRAGVSTMPKTLRPELSDAAQEVILKALSHDPEARYTHAYEMGEAFLRAVELTDNFGPKVTKAMNEDAAPAQPVADKPEDGHVLFMDLVGFTQRSMPEQNKLLDKLHEIVRKAPTFKQAQSSKQVESLPTGDGMALVFFKNPAAAVQCALEIANGLQQNPDVKLRMGVHSGPIYRRLDINENMNILGGGINLAQRVMDSGDAGHILVSRSVADNLIQLGEWEAHLHDLGEHKVKQTRVHLFNLCKGGLGCPDWPSKLPRPACEVGAPPKPSIAISAELREQCAELFKSLDEFRSPEQLRAFANLNDLKMVERCIPYAGHLDFDLLVSKLLNTKRSLLEPALFDLLDALARRYRDDMRGEVFTRLKDELRKAMR
jgi:serine/threonine protein kinase